MTTIAMEAIDVAREIPLWHLSRHAGETERGPGMPLLGFMIGMVLSAGLWGLIGFAAWVIIT